MPVQQVPHNALGIDIEEDRELGGELRILLLCGQSIVLFATLAKRDAHYKARRSNVRWLVYADVHACSCSDEVLSTFSSLDLLRAWHCCSGASFVMQ